ncbi:MAG: hypothetical protein ACOY4O_16675 [Pseudomonadota bacterium]
MITADDLANSPKGPFTVRDQILAKLDELFKAIELTGRPLTQWLRRAKDIDGNVKRLDQAIQNFQDESVTGLPAAGLDSKLAQVLVCNLKRDLPDKTSDIDELEILLRRFQLIEGYYDGRRRKIGRFAGVLIEEKRLGLFTSMASSSETMRDRDGFRNILKTHVSDLREIDQHHEALDNSIALLNGLDAYGTSLSLTSVEIGVRMAMVAREGAYIANQCQDLTLLRHFQRVLEIADHRLPKHDPVMAMWRYLAQTYEHRILLDAQRIKYTTPFALLGLMALNAGKKTVFDVNLKSERAAAKSSVGNEFRWRGASIDHRPDVFGTTILTALKDCEDHASKLVGSEERRLRALTIQGQYLLSSKNEKMAGKCIETASVLVPNEQRGWGPAVGEFLLLRGRMEQWAGERGKALDSYKDALKCFTRGGSRTFIFEARTRIDKINKSPR